MHFTCKEAHSTVPRHHQILRCYLELQPKCHAIGRGRDVMLLLYLGSLSVYFSFQYACTALVSGNMALRLIAVLQKLKGKRNTNSLINIFSSDIYGGNTRGCFSCLQSMGAKMCSSLMYVIIIICFFGIFGFIGIIIDHQIYKKHCI